MTISASNLKVLIDYDQELKDIWESLLKWHKKQKTAASEVLQ